MAKWQERWVDVGSSWSAAVDDCGDRLILMLRAKALLYVFGFVLGLGALGVWTAVGMNLYQSAAPRDVYLSLLTFAAAVAISGAFDGVSQASRSGFLVMLAFVAAGGALLIPLVVGVIAWQDQAAPWTDVKTTIGWRPVALGTLPPVLVWWFFNATDGKFAADAPYTAAAGGDPMQKIA